MASLDIGFGCSSLEETCFSAEVVEFQRLIGICRLLYLSIYCLGLGAGEGTSSTNTQVKLTLLLQLKLTLVRVADPS